MPIYLMRCDSCGEEYEDFRRVGEVAKLLVEAGIFTIAAFTSPYSCDRLAIRKLFNEDDEEFIKVYLKCDLSR